MDERAPAASDGAFRLSDPLLAWGIGLVGAVVAGLWAPRDGQVSALEIFGIILPAQTLATLAALLWISRRRGTGDLAADYGLRIRTRDWSGLLLGLVLQVAVVLALAPLARMLGIDEPPQALARLIGEVREPWTMAVVAVSVGLLGPLAEEVLFRGLLLRVLRSRTGTAWAVTLQAVAFGLVHLLDPGAAVAVPVFIVLGVVLGMLAVRDGRLGRAFFTHAGVNLTATLATFAALGA